MKFVPVAGTQVLFSVWETRVQDYEKFVKATGRDWPKPNFEQGLTHPAVNVSWEDAKAFCAWLTQKERQEGTILPLEKYRLPTDEEWSAAVGNHKYPWGKNWPPSEEAGNYGESLKIDGYQYTSPVGSFTPNKFGLHDIAGNVWQWCEDWYRGAMNPASVLRKWPFLKAKAGERQCRTVRGGSWYSWDPDELLSSYRGGDTPDYRDDLNGFRCVLAGDSSR